MQELPTRLMGCGAVMVSVLKSLWAGEMWQEALESRMNGESVGVMWVGSVYADDVESAWWLYSFQSIEVVCVMFSSCSAWNVANLKLFSTIGEKAICAESTVCCTGMYVTPFMVTNWLGGGGEDAGGVSAVLSVVMFAEFVVAFVVLPPLLFPEVVLFPPV